MYIYDLFVYTPFRHCVIEKYIVRIVELWIGVQVCTTIVLECQILPHHQNRLNVQHHAANKHTHKWRDTDSVSNWENQPESTVVVIVTMACVRCGRHAQSGCSRQCYSTRTGFATLINDARGQLKLSRTRPIRSLTFWLQRNAFEILLEGLHGAQVRPTWTTLLNCFIHTIRCDCNRNQDSSEQKLHYPGAWLLEEWDSRIVHADIWRINKKVQSHAACVYRSVIVFQFPGRSCVCKSWDDEAWLENVAHTMKIKNIRITLIAE